MFPLLVSVVIDDIIVVVLISRWMLSQRVNMDAVMHNWANPKKMEYELSVPSDMHYA